MVSGLQYDASGSKLKLLELERAVSLSFMIPPVKKNSIYPINVHSGIFMIVANPTHPSWIRLYVQVFGSVLQPFQISIQLSTFISLISFWLRVHSIFLDGQSH